MFLPRERDGKPVLGGLKLIDPSGQSAAERIRRPPPKVDMANVKLLSDMTPEDQYKGFQGGLNPDVKSDRPTQHTFLN